MSVHENEAGVAKNSIIESIKKSILDFEKNFPLDSLQRTNFGQQPLITVLTCSDSRVPLYVFGETFNRIFSVENIGNQVKTSEGSILYGLLHLHTPLMLIAGHSDCGALKAASSDYSGEPGAIVRELDNVKRSLHEIQSSAYALQEEPSVKYTQLAELNVDMQVKYMLANTAVARLVEEGSLFIIGTILDLHNVYGQGYGKSYLINYNGVRHLPQLQQIKELKDLTAQMQRLTAV